MTAKNTSFKLLPALVIAAVTGAFACQEGLSPLKDESSGSDQKNDQTKECSGECEKDVMNNKQYDEMIDMLEEENKNNGSCTDYGTLYQKTESVRAQNRVNFEAALAAKGLTAFDYAASITLCKSLGENSCNGYEDLQNEFLQATFAPEKTGDFFKTGEIFSRTDNDNVISWYIAGPALTPAGNMCGETVRFKRLAQDANGKISEVELTKTITRKLELTACSVCEYNSPLNHAGNPWEGPCTISGAQAEDDPMTQKIYKLTDKTLEKVSITYDVVETSAAGPVDPQCGPPP